MSESVALVRCRLDGSEERPSQVLRYVPAAEFELWRYLMETRHRRRVTAHEVAAWIPDHEGVGPEVDVDTLEPVLRLEFDKPQPDGTMVPVRRFLPAETYPEARRALLSHFDPQCRWKLVATAGYFVPSARRIASPADADTLPRFELASDAERLEGLEPAFVRR